METWTMRLVFNRYGSHPYINLAWAYRHTGKMPYNPTSPPAHVVAEFEYLIGRRPTLEATWKLLAGDEGEDYLNDILELTRKIAKA